MHRRHPLLQRVNHLVYIISVLFSLSLHLHVPVQAQSYQPFLTVYSGNTFVDGKGLYVIGGANATSVPVNQTCTIDLSVSWKTANPVYKEFPPADLCIWCPTTMSGDGKRWFVFLSQINYALDTQANMWTPFLTYSGELGYAAATDPATGRVFIPMFATSEDPMSAMMSMFIVDSKDYTSRTDNATSVMMHGWYKYAVTWNVVLKKILMTNMDGIYAYTPERGWRNFTGPPGLRGTDGLCMVSSSSGSKVVLFGGFSKTLNATVGDIFILDTATLTWKNGTSGGPIRRDGACAMSGDYFIVWGGATDTVDKVAPPMTLVYSLKTDKWTSNYIAPNDDRTRTTPSGQGESHPTDTSSEADTPSRTRNVGTIVGAVAGVLAIGLIIGGILLHRARKRRSKALSSSTNNTYLNNNSRKRTVHVGTYGTRYEEQNPHTCPLGIARTSKSRFLEHLRNTVITLHGPHVPQPQLCMVNERVKGLHMQ